MAGTPVSGQGGQVHRDRGEGTSKFALSKSDEQGLVRSGHPLDRGLGVWEILQRNQERVEIVGIGDDRPVVLDGNPAVAVLFESALVHLTSIARYVCRIEGLRGPRVVSLPQATDE